MPIVLYRVDDRLIHGQVIIGWGRPLGVEFIVLVDDQVRSSPWEQDLYRMSVPAGVEVIFASVEEAAHRLAEWVVGGRKGFVLTGDIDSMARLRAANTAVDRINLGGLHHKPGRTERLPFVYLTDEELRALQALEAGGAQITAQDVPTSPPVALRSL
jgi:mannose/fructose/N-acetylgalactosamine-specific phosphotransferase system component IIB